MDDLISRQVAIDVMLAALISKIRGVDERLKDTLETCIKA